MNRKELYEKHGIFSGGYIKSLFPSSTKHSTSKYKNKNKKKFKRSLPVLFLYNWKQKMHFFRIVSFFTSVAQLLS